MKCPCCKTELGTSRLLVDLGSNTVAYDDWQRLGPSRELEIIYVLNESWPKVVGYTELAYRIWGGGGWAEGWKRVLMTYVCRARKVDYANSNYLHGTYRLSVGVLMTTIMTWTLIIKLASTSWVAFEGFPTKTDCDTFSAIAAPGKTHVCLPRPQVIAQQTTPGGTNVTCQPLTAC